MQLITRLDNAYVWIRTKGVYKQADLYARGRQLFAKVGSGYVRLSAHSATSSPNTVWLELDPGDCAMIDEPKGRDPVFLGFRPESKLTAVV